MGSEQERMKRMKKMSRVLGIDINQVSRLGTRVVPRFPAHKRALCTGFHVSCLRCSMVRNNVESGMSTGNVPAP